jgi:hypothetical protein
VPEGRIPRAGALDLARAPAGLEPALEVLVDAGAPDRADVAAAGD